jgi:hypothetical protein
LCGKFCLFEAILAATTRSAVVILASELILSTGIQNAEAPITLLARDVMPAWSNPLQADAAVCEKPGRDFDA